MTMERTEAEASLESSPTSGFSISNLLGLASKEFNKFQATRQDLHEESEEKVSRTPKSNRSFKAQKTRPSKSLSPDPEGKRYRATFDKAQIFQMERVFLMNHYPDVSARTELSRGTGLTESQVQIWFQNRRAKWRKQQRKRRHEIPAIFGLGYPTHLARLYPGYEPYGMFPYEYYNTDFWTCAQQQIAALQYTGIPAPGVGLVPSPPRSSESSTSSPAVSPTSSTSSSPTTETSSLETSLTEKAERNTIEVRNDASLLSLRLKAKEHEAALDEPLIDVTS